MGSKPVIQIENLHFSYGDIPVLKDVNLTIHDREFVWVVGPNGGGKTTLVKLLIGLLQPSSGSVTVFGQSPEQSRSRIGYMPQQVHIDRSFPASVMDIALMGTLGNGGSFGRYSKPNREAAASALADVGLYDLRDRHFSTLSGGQQRRLFIARSLACKPDILLLDEPMANLDVVVEKDLSGLLQKLNEQLTVVLVSHDPALVSQFVKDVVCVNHTVAVHPTFEIDGEMLGDLYRGKVRVVRHDKTAHGEEE